MTKQRGVTSLETFVLLTKDFKGNYDKNKDVNGTKNLFLKHFCEGLIKFLLEFYKKLSIELPPRP